MSLNNAVLRLYYAGEALFKALLRLTKQALLRPYYGAIWLYEGSRNIRQAREAVVVLFDMVNFTELSRQEGDEGMLHHYLLVCSVYLLY